MYYFKQYEQHPGEEGWYVYFKPADPRCRAIKEQGPLREDEADGLVARFTKQRGLDA